MLLGANEAQLADALNVSKPTIDYWKQQKPEFLQVLKAGKIEADANVAKALYHRALGYSHPDTVVLTNTVKTYDDDGKLIESHVEPLLVPMIKYYPPDSYAANKWLSLRQRELWNDVTQININHSGSVNLNYLQQIENPEMVTDQELMVALNKGMELALIKNNAAANN